MSPSREIWGTMRAFGAATLLVSGIMLSACDPPANAQQPDRELPASQDEVFPASEHPAVSPDGTAIAFSSDVASTPDIWVVQRDRSALRRLTPFDDSFEESPDWSPDGTKIAFGSNRQSGSYNIWVVDADGANPVSLTDLASTSYDSLPRWSPDGLHIAFVSTRTGKRELWLMNADGSGEVQLTDLTVAASDPAWSPSGDMLAFTGCADVCNIYTIATSGASATPLTDAAGEDIDPDWSDAGIVFRSTRGGGRLWLVQPDGTGLTPFGDPFGGADFDPRWDTISENVFASRVGGLASGESSIFELIAGSAVATELIGFPLYAPGTCGDNVVDLEEVCDDGNRNGGDGCSADCLSNEVCGNGVFDIGEFCEDGNTLPGDGCSPTCEADGVCGNGELDTGEVCDDANTTSGDGCSANCLSDETCGNSITDVGEVCDDGNTVAGDGCSADCSSNESCGNGVVDFGEECDDGNVLNGDGCSSVCSIEQSTTLPPRCDDAVPSPQELWPPNNRFEEVTLEGITDPEGEAVSVVVTGVTQDEAVGSNRCPDAEILGDTVNLLRQRDGDGNGRVYRVSFTATDASGGACSGQVRVCVPHDQGDPECIEGSLVADSTVCE